MIGSRSRHERTSSAGAVHLAGVGDRVAAEAVGDRLEQRRLALVARLRQQPRGGLAHGQDVVAVDPLAVHAVGGRAPPQLRLGVRLLDRGAHAVLVVDHLEDDRKAPQLGQVERLVERAGGDRAVAELAQDRVWLVAVDHRQRGAGGDRQVGADDAPAAEEVALDVEQVHRAAAAVGDARVLAEQLGHDRRRGASDRQGGGVVAVAGVERIALREGVDRAHRGGLLADRKVAVAADPRTGVLLLGALLEAADQGHLPEEAERVLAVVQHRDIACGGLRHARNLTRCDALGCPRNGERRQGSEAR